MAAGSNPAVWFEIPVTDLERARAFYAAVLGVDLTPDPDDPGRIAWFPMTRNGYGATGALISGEGYTPSADGAVVYLSVADVTAALERAAAAGGRIALERVGIGEHGFVGWFEDPDGNRVGVHALI